MAILSLGYIGIRSNKLDDWNSFSTGQLGMCPVEHAGKQMAFRMDDRKQRLVVSDEPESTGAGVTRATSALCDRRFVSDMIFFEDPNGNRVELFHKPMI